MHFQWAEQIRVIRDSHPYSLTAPARNALNEVYVEVMSAGLKQSIQDAIAHGLDRNATLDDCAFLLTRQPIQTKDDACDYYREITRAAREFPDLIYRINQMNLTQFNNVAVSFSPGDDYEVLLGLMLIKNYPGTSDSKVEDMEQRLAAIREMLEIYNSPDMQVQYRITLQSLQASLENKPFSPERPGHMALRELVFGHQKTNNVESQEALRRTIEQLAGMSPFDTQKMRDDLARIELNATYLKKYLVSDFYYMLGSIYNDAESSHEVAKENLSHLKGVGCVNLFKQFLKRHGLDAQELGWSLYTGKSASMAQERAALYEPDQDYVARHMISTLCDGDGTGDHDSPEALYSILWLKALEPDEYMALQLEDREWLKLYEIQGDANILKKLVKEASREKAFNIDLGL